MVLDMNRDALNIDVTKIDHYGEVGTFCVHDVPARGLSAVIRFTVHYEGIGLACCPVVDDVTLVEVIDEDGCSESGWTLADIDIAEHLEAIEDHALERMAAARISWAESEMIEP
jgi:hypothetical protein